VFPYRDNLIAKGRSYGVLSLVALLAALNIPLFLDEDLQRRVVALLGFVPIRFALHPWAQLPTLITSVFLHGDIFHLLGNSLFLVVFGRSLERLFGPVTLLLFPLLGLAGLLAHWSLYPNSNSPVIGASGAIAFLMGSYLVLFPEAKIRMIVFFGWLWKRFTLPAWVFLGYWGVLQLFSTLEGSQDGVAYAVHAGSFIAGAVAAMAWKTSYPYAEERLLEFTTQTFS
jgi:membrane associated rhomboid family serine protease